MTRPLRLEHPGALWHVHNRGVERRPTFLDDRDRQEFLDRFAEAVERYRWRVHTFTLMTNHFHLLIQTMEPTLSRGMQKLEGDYARKFNRRHTRVGPLFQGRFRAHLVDSECYLLELARYIVLNPVRAGMVRSPADWVWSSYRALAGLSAPPPWLWLRSILESFHPTDRLAAMAGYRDFVARGIGSAAASPLENLVAQLYLGSQGFIARVEEMVRNRAWAAENSRSQQYVRAFGLTEVRRVVESQFGVSIVPKCWRNERARHAFAVLAREEAVSTLAATGSVLQLSTSAVHHLLGRATRLQQTDSKFRLELAAARQALRAEANPF